MGSYSIYISKIKDESNVLRFAYSLGGTQLFSMNARVWRHAAAARSYSSTHSPLVPGNLGGMLRHSRQSTALCNNTPSRVPDSADTSRYVLPNLTHRDWEKPSITVTGTSIVLRPFVCRLSGRWSTVLVGIVSLFRIFELSLMTLGNSDHL